MSTRWGETFVAVLSAVALAAGPGSLLVGCSGGGPSGSGDAATAPPGADTRPADGATGASAEPPNLLFSEYVEGAGDNRALEIFNLGPDTVALGDCRVDLYEDGAATAPRSIALASRTFATGETHVLCHAGFGDLAPCDQLDGGLVHSGNDALALVCALPGGEAIVDVFAQIGVDPGEDGWISGDVTTRDHTLRRRCAVTKGDRVADDPFDPAAEWEVFSHDAFDDLGHHCR